MYGATGATGNGISNITNYYLASPNSSGITTSTSGWTTSVQSVSSSKKYLWNYEAIAYTNGSSVTTTPCIIGTYGDKGDNAKNVTLTATSQVFKSTDGGLTFAPDNIVITPNYQNVSYSKWQYSTNGGSSWTDVSSSTNGVAYSSTSLTLSKSSTLFTSSITSISFKILTNDSSVNDTITIVKLYDVADLEIGGRNLWIKSKTTGYSAIENLGENHVTGQTECYRINNGGTLSFIIEPDFSSRLYRKVIFSAWVKYENVVQGENNWNKFNVFKHSMIRKNTSSGATTSQDFLTLGGFTGTSDWKFIQYTYDYSANKSYDQLKTGLRFNLEGTKSGTAWVTGIKVELGNKATDWTPAPEDLDKNISDVKNSLNSFQNTVNTTFKDGIIEQAEAKAIAQHLKTLDAEKADIDKEYSTIYGNSLLGGTAKTNLEKAKREFNNAHDSLKSTINTVISDGKVTSTEKASVDSTFTTYNGVLGTYKQRVQEALDAIGSAKVDNIQIGGKNLLTGTKDFTGWGVPGTATLDETYNGVTVYKNSYIGGSGGFKDLAKYNTITPEPKTEYTLSFWAKGTGDIKSFFYPDTVKNGVGSQGQKTTASDGRISTKLSSDWERYWITWTTTDSVEGIKSIIPCRMEGSADITAYICGVKLEIGNKATDWTPAPEDIDQQLTSIKTDLQTQVDGKIDTWSQESPDPASSWATSDEKLKHKGDIWYKPTSKETYRYTGTSWERLYDKIAENATNIANQKRRVFVSTPTTPYDVGDLWINNEELYRCKTALSSGSYNSGHWVKAVKYTDDSVAQSAKNDLQAFKKLDEWLVINNELDTYFPFDNNLQTTGGINPNSGHNAYLTPQGKFGNCLSIQEDVVNLFAFNNISELNVQGNGTTLTTTKLTNEEVVCKYIPSSSTGLVYRGKDIAVDTQRTYTLSGWMYVSENYNSTSAPAIKGEQGFGKLMAYDMNKKGQWQFFNHTMKPSSGTARILLYPRTSSSVENATTGYVLYKNVQFTQTGAVHMFYNGTKPKDTISYEVSQPDVSTMMAYKKHVLDSNFKHQALVKNGSTFTFYENGIATTNYVNKWRVYACEGITTPGTDGKNIDKYNKPLSTQLTTDLTGISHSWQATGYGYVYRTFLYCSQAKTVTLMINFDNAGCAYCNGVLAGQGGYNASGNRCVFNLVKG